MKDYFEVTQDDADNAYKAGQQSQQAKIDCLEVELDGANERALMLLNHKNNMVDKMQAEIDRLKQVLKTSLTAHECACLERDELQVRIDLVIAKVNEYYDTDGMSDLVFFDVANILKGKENE